ncbi:MAG TPA: DUF58 domain-containing protein [Phycisphaerales bacterium]|nr:DUF58 domain-containing protein [Phycisphaerales bacterium]
MPSDTAIKEPGAGRRGRNGSSLFDADFLKKLETLNLIARQLVRGRRAAMRPSIKKGASIEFKDFREYSPGDDPRTVDWMAYARLGELFIKLFRQEEELDLWVLLDRSTSMNFGEPNKFDHARRIAAALAYIGMSNMDSASVLPFDEGLAQGMPRLRGKGPVLRVMDYLEGLTTAPATDFEKTAQMFMSRVRRPGIVVVISDFYGLQRARAGLDRLRFMKHQMHVVQVVSPWERDPPLRGELKLVDAETGQQQNLTITDGLLKKYKAAYEGLSTDLRAYSMKYSIGFDQAHTDVAFDEFVRRVLQHGRLLA